MAMTRAAHPINLLRLPDVRQHSWVMPMSLEAAKFKAMYTVEIDYVREHGSHRERAR